MFGRSERSSFNPMRFSGAALLGIAVMLLGSGCANSNGGPGLVGCANVPNPGNVQTKAWSGKSDKLTEIQWPFSSKWEQSIEHWCVPYTSKGGATALHVLCGVESNLRTGAEFSLEPRASYDGPALRLEHGFAFITFQWPLIWMQNIDAGSVGTTAIARRHGNEIQIFLIRNARQLNTLKPTTDCQSGLEMASGGGFPDETIGFEKKTQWDIVMTRHEKQGSTGFFKPIGTGNGSSFKRTQWRFNVSSALSGTLSVTPDDPGELEAATFLRKILEVAQSEGLYTVPGDCP
jgi:hypothetical protein